MSQYPTTIEIKVPAEYELVISKEELIREMEVLAIRLLADLQVQGTYSCWKSPNTMKNT